MLLLVERIKEAILHPDPEVREAAAFYFSRSYSLDPSIMPLAIQAVERYGRDVFVIPTFMEKLLQTDATVAWLIRQIEQVGTSTDEREDLFASALVTALCHANPAVLKPHEATIRAMRKLEATSKEVIADRIYVNSFTPDALWRELTDWCDSQDDLEAVADEDFEYACSVVVAMSRYPDQLADKVLVILADKENVYDEWWEGFLVQLAGEMRLEAAIPYLVDRLEETGDWLGEEAHEALAKIGTDAVVQELAQRYSDEDWGFRLGGISLLEDIHTDFSVQTCLDFLDQETEVDLRGQLIQSILMNFSSAGIEPARQHVLNTPKTPDVLEVRSALLVACKMMGETFPEFEAWSEDTKHDGEFRQQWYKEHNLNPDFDDDNFEEDEFDDEGSEDVKDDDFSDDETPLTVVRRGERVGRNDACPCGSGKKYKKCCYGKGQILEETDESHSFVMGSVRGGKSASKYPVGTVALYGPDETTTTKIVAGVIKREGAEAIVERWVGTNITKSPKAQRQMQEFFDRHKVKSIVIAEANIGCLHEEGSDFPTGQDCPFCPFWAGKQGSNRRD